MLEFQRTEGRLVATPLAALQRFPGAVGRHLLGRLVELMEYLAARVLPQNRIVVIEQNLDANRTFDQWQLLVEQAAKDVGAKVELVDYVRFQLGEGIEKEVSDFAAEVAAAAGV